MNTTHIASWIHYRWRMFFITLLTAVSLAVVLGLYAWQRFGGDVPVTYDKIEEHFKYGSTGGEHESGFPYWIFQAMPRICGQYLPGKGYESLGMIYEPGHDLPIGMSRRRYQGVDRTFLNCAVCHASTVRAAPGEKPEIVLAMPAQTFDLMGFQKFIFACGKDGKFSKEYLIPEIAAMKKEQGQRLDWIDRKVVYPLAVWIMRERLISLADRFAWSESQKPWGPGRVDTFNAAKVLFNIPVHELPAKELNASSDFPSIWNQLLREGMQLHWDGNNTDVTERNKSAAFGTGTTPPTLDTKAIKRLEDWLLKLDAPKYRWAVDTAKAERGKKIYSEYCAACHGASSRDFSGEYVGKVTPWKEVLTDKHRLDSYSYDLAVNQSTLYAGYPWRFTHFRKTFGYANMPLDGLWLRAPYLHNGSVPNLRSLLDRAALRPTKFYRGDDVYDQERVGFRSTESGESGGSRKYFLFDTTVEGNGNAGHEGARYGTELPPADKDALVEYLKTF